MVELSTLAENIEKGLNALSTLNSLGIVFKIHSDAGDYAKALKSRTAKQRYTNGLLSVVSSSIVPVQNLVVATQSARLEIAVQLPNPNTDTAIITAHRAVLDGYFKSTPIQMLTDKDGKTYSVSLAYALASTGNVDNMSPLGTNVTFTVMIDYAMVQNGLNSSQFSITLDGAAVEYVSLTIDRTAAMDSAPYSNTNGAGKNVAVSTALTFSIEIPATTTENAANAALRDFVLDGDMQTVHTLTVEIGGVSRSYSVVFASNNISLNGIQNAGYTVRFVEAADLTEEEEDDGGTA